MNWSVILFPIFRDQKIQNRVNWDSLKPWTVIDSWPGLWLGFVMPHQSPKNRTEKSNKKQINTITDPNNAVLSTSALTKF